MQYALVCVHTQTHVYLYCMHNHVCVHRGVRVCACIDMCMFVMHVYKLVCTCIYAHTFKHICAYAWIYACGWVARMCAWFVYGACACVCICFGPWAQYLIPKLVKWFTRRTVQAKLNRKRAKLSRKRTTALLASFGTETHRECAQDGSKKQLPDF